MGMERKQRQQLKKNGNIYENMWHESANIRHTMYFIVFRVCSPDYDNKNENENENKNENRNVKNF